MSRSLLLSGSVLAFAYIGEVETQEATVIAETCGEPLRIEAVRELHFGGPDDPGRIMEVPRLRCENLMTGSNPVQRLRAGAA